MNPSILCSKLRHAFDELQNLTTQELVECKWSIVQRIFILLFSKSRNLCEQHEKIVDLMEDRNIELQSRRISTDKRDGWTEKNNIFKTDFMRLIIDGLILLRWPPSCIAFSDPLETLLADPRDAFVFILQFGITVENNRQTRIKRNEESYDSNNLLTPRTDRQRQQKEVTPKSSDKIVSHNNRLPLSSREGSYTEYDMNPVSGDVTDNGIDRGLDIDISNSRDRDQKGIERSDQKGIESNLSPSNKQFESPLEKDNQQQHRTPRQNTTEKDRKCEFVKRESLPTQKDFKKLSLSLEIMQHQNEMLSKQLKRMQENVCARDNAEAHMGALLNEMKVSVDDIVDMTSGRGSRERSDDRTSEKANGSKLFAGLGMPSGSEAGVLTTQLNLEFLEEVRKEAKEKDDEKKDKEGSLYGRGKSTIDGKGNIEQPFSSKPKIPSVIPCKSTVMWSKVQAQFTGILKQWEHARKEARSCIFQSTDLHPSSNHYLLSNKDNHGNGINESIVGKGWSRDNNIKYNDGQSSQGNIECKDNDRGHIEIKNYDSLNYRIKLHQVLGVRPPISLIREYESTNQLGNLYACLYIKSFTYIKTNI
jgi:hypothetical protein